MSKHLLASVVVALALLAQPAQAQIAQFDVRVGAQTVEPTGDIGNRFDYGYGAYLRAGNVAEPWSLMGAVTWTRFIAKDGLANDTNEFTLQVGPHFVIREGFDFGVEAAYLMESEEVGLVPVLSIGLSNIEATLSYNTTFRAPAANWLALGIGLKF